MDLKDKYIKVLENQMEYLDDFLEGAKDLLDRQTRIITKQELEIADLKDKIGKLESELNLEKAKNLKIYYPYENPYQKWPLVTYKTSTSPFMSISEPSSESKKETSKGASS